MNTNNNSPRLTAPKVTFSGKESLMRPVAHPSAIWIKVASVAASLILLVGGATIFWSDNQSPSLAPNKTNTLARTMLAEQSPTTAPIQIATAKVNKGQQTEKITTKTKQKKDLTKQNTTENEPLKRTAHKSKIADKKPKRLIATIINPTIIRVNAKLQATPIDTKVPLNHTTFSPPKFRTVTVFEDIKKSIIEQVQETPLRQIIVAAQKKAIERDQKSNEVLQEDYIL